MERFTQQEINLICIYDPGTRKGLLSEIAGMTNYLMPDETELRHLAESVLVKVRRMTDVEYRQIISRGIALDLQEDSHAG